MKSFRSFSDISLKYKPIVKFFEEKTSYLAHMQSNKEKEPLFEHIIRVEHYFELLTKVHGIESTIDKLIGEISFNNNETGAYIKALFYSAIIFHDFGKVNPNFQIQKLNNAAFRPEIKIQIGTEHSFLSAYIFLNHHSNKIYKTDYNNGDKNLLWCFTFLFTIPILKHHSGFINKDYDFAEEKINSIVHLLDILEFENIQDLSRQIIAHEKLDTGKNLWTFFDKTASENDFNFFALFTLLKLNYSLLTASDYYATSEYMNGLKFNNNEDFGLLDQRLKKHLSDSFKSTKDFNEKLFNDTDHYLSFPFPNLQEISNYNLNILRQKLTAEVINGIEKHKEERIFYIEAPTGGGKTNISMAAVIKLLEQHEEINKIFYVFPFTTLVTQTFASIKETFKVSNQHVTQVHAKAGFQTKQKEDDEHAEYGDQLKNQIDNLFVNYPITLMTHVKFFDILKSNKKDSNYLLHRLANSIVIIDELQAYNPKHWDKIKYFISNYACFFNIRFIIMSATLPEIGSIALSDKELINFHHLIPDAQKKYLQNPNFSQRVKFNMELLNKKELNIPELAEFSYRKSEEYAKKRTDAARESVFTIIEFIFKKTATEFYDHIIENNQFQGFEIFVLSGTIIEPRRKEIINFIKDERNRNKKVLLITTQVVEAGVDIDMDLGFKNQSLPDSDEQLAGRVNRNVNKRDCELYLFRINEPKTIYGKDFRYKIAQNYSPEEIKKLLQEKKFKKLYGEVIKRINKEEISKAGKEDFTEYKNKFKKLNFHDINRDFRLIENDSNPVFIPVDIDILNYQFRDRIDYNFEEAERKFIKEKNCFADEDENKVSGEKIWNIYLQLIQNKNIDYNTKNREHKILNGIMSKFIITVYSNKINELKEYFEYNENYQDFKYLQYYKFRKQETGKGKIYDYFSGLNEKKLKNSFDIF